MRTEHLNASTISLSDGIDPPAEAWEWVTQTECDCGCKTWHEGTLKLVDWLPPMRVNYCDECESVQMNIREVKKGQTCKTDTHK